MKFIKYLTLAATIAAYANIATAVLDDAAANVNADVVDTTAANINTANSISEATMKSVNDTINDVNASLAALNKPQSTEIKPAIKTTQAPTSDEDQIWICKPAKKDQITGNGNGSKPSAVTNDDNNDDEDESDDD